MFDLSVVIPAYNEAQRILPTLKSFHHYLSTQPLSFEIVVVSDGSTDATVACVQAFSIQNPEVRVIDYKYNKGKGYALRMGLLDAKGKWCVFSDADGSTPIEEVEKLLLPLHAGTADVVIGSRYIKGATITHKQPYYRRVWSRLSNKIMQRFLLPGIVDPHCGFKAFTQEAAQALFSNAEVNGWSFDLEILALARKFNLRITEVPVTWSNDDKSKGRLRHLPREVASVRQIRKRVLATNR